MDAAIEPLAEQPQVLRLVPVLAVGRCLAMAGCLTLQQHSAARGCLPLSLPGKLPAERWTSGMMLMQWQYCPMAQVCGDQEGGMPQLCAGVQQRAMSLTPSCCKGQQCWWMMLLLMQVLGCGTLSRLAQENRALLTAVPAEARCVQATESVAVAVAVAVVAVAVAAGSLAVAIATLAAVMVTLAVADSEWLTVPVVDTDLVMEMTNVAVVGQLGLGSAQQLLVQTAATQARAAGEKTIPMDLGLLL